MITVTGRLAAWAFLAGAFGGLAASVTYAAVANRVTRPEAVGGTVAFVVFVAAAAWLRRDTLHGRQP